MAFVALIGCLFLISAGTSTIFTQKEDHPPFRLTLGIFMLLLGLFLGFFQFLNMV